MKNKKLLFVIQKHKATSLHYDFRLEIGNTIPSWSIPKGLTLDSTLKRLAMATSDHEMEYRNFEGVIKEGSFGAGPVMIWDEGVKVMSDGLEKGEIKFFLEGKKLKGSFALIKTKGFPPGKKNSWLLIKHKDEFCLSEYDANNYDFSARSGKKLEEIKN